MGGDTIGLEKEILVLQTNLSNSEKENQRVSEELKQVKERSVSDLNLEKEKLSKAESRGIARAEEVFKSQEEKHNTLKAELENIHKKYSAEFENIANKILDEILKSLLTRIRLASMLF